jgi:hypothetical protein
MIFLDTHIPVLQIREFHQLLAEAAPADLGRSPGETISCAIPSALVLDPTGKRSDCSGESQMPLRSRRDRRIAITESSGPKAFPRYTAPSKEPCTRRR